MDILTQDDMDARISSARPLSATGPRPLPPATPSPEGLWNIECPWEPGTFVSVMWARLYAAQLLQRVAESEKRNLQREFKREQERNKETTHQYTTVSDECFVLRGEVAALKRRLQNKRAKR
jgi:hypothetical protein